MDTFTDLELALPFIRNWEDCGIPEIHYYRVFARCSVHQVIQAIWDEPPVDNDKLICGQCSEMIRKCPIFGFTEIRRPVPGE